MASNFRAHFHNAVLFSEPYCSSVLQH